VDAALAWFVAHADVDAAASLAADATDAASSSVLLLTVAVFRRRRIARDDVTEDADELHEVEEWRRRLSVDDDDEFERRRSFSVSAFSYSCNVSSTQQWR
jgi:hypothetical protein